VGVNPREAGSKEVRAQVWASRIQDGLVHLVRDGTWDVEGFVAEAIAFPNGAHDDQVDAVSLAVQALGSGSGWALYAKRKVEEWRAEGRQVDEVPRPWLTKPIEEEFGERVRKLAEGYGDPVDVPDGLDVRRAGAVMATIAARYLDGGQAIKAQIVLMERKRLGI
jgi:hypothetical protein